MNDQASETLDLETAPSVTNSQSQPDLEYSAIVPGLSNNNIPVDRAVNARRQTLTLAGTSRIRIMWTDDMNRAVIRFYFTTTKLETDFSNYKTQMLELFNTQFPRFVDRITTSKLMERKRYLLKSNKISQSELNEIKQSVERELQIDPIVNIDNDDNLSSSPPESSILTREIVENQQERFESEEEEEMFNDLIHKINFALISYMGTDPTLRPMLPRLRYSHKLIRIIRILNDRILPIILNDYNDPKDLQTIIYCAAYASTTTLGLKITHLNYEEQQGIKKKYPWRIRLEKRITKTRAKLGRLTQFQRGQRSQKLKNKINKEIQPLIIEELTTLQLTELLHSTTQRLRILANRLKRYTERIQRKVENEMFDSNQSKFYRNLKIKKNEIGSTDNPQMNEITEYWSNMWENRTSYNKEATWMKEESLRTNNLIDMNNTVITAEDVKEATKKTNNWKTPGIDGVHNFWYKKLTALHSKLAILFNNILCNPTIMPVFMTQGFTYLIKKDININTVSNYRPITCLPTIYKLFTSIITNKIYQHCANNNIITMEQKGYGKQSKGCKDQIIIDSVVVEQATHKNRNLSMAYIDYQKAFDSMSHEYMLEILKLYKVSKNIINFFAHAIQIWTTKLVLKNGIQCQFSRSIKIARGIFQGDSLSPLWFCLGMNPLSNMLKSTNYGFDVKSNVGMYKISHLFFMDDLKIYANSQEQLQKMLKLTEKFSLDINMNFNNDKSKTVHLYKGKLMSTTGYVTENDNIIRDIAANESYKYLGFAQLRGILHTEVKHKMQKEFKKRVNEVLKTLLNSKNKTKAINQFVIPYLTYSFGLIKWSNTDLEDLERDLRRYLRFNRMHDPKSAVERICLPRNEGGRGFLDLKNLYIKQIEKLRHYFINETNNIEMYRIINEADEGYTPLHLKNSNYCSSIISKTVEENIDSWKRKTIHGIFINHMHDENIDKYESNRWLTNGELFGETEGFMISIQDRVVPTRNYRKYILHEDITIDKCRLCGKTGENIDHILNGCTSLAASEYLERHNNVAKIIHQDLAIRCNFVTEKTPYYKYMPTSIFEDNENLLSWDRSMETDKEVQSNKPDIIYWDKRKQKLYIIDITIPLNQMLQNSYGEKIRKYSELQVELRDLWRVKESFILPIIVSSTGLIPYTLKNALEKLDLEYETEKMQKAVILSSCSIVRKFLAN